MKINKTHKIVAVVAIVLVIAIVIFKSRKSQVYSPTTKSESSNDELPSVGKSSNLKRGTTALEVLRVQEKYNSYARANEKSTILEDGIFGSETEGAVLEITGGKSTTLAEFESIIKSK